MIRRYKSVEDLPQPIPVFPLAGTILLPRATLPLNIFEPRYLSMIEDAIRGSRTIGIIQPAGDGGATGSPQSRSAGLRNVGCAGRITMFQELEDGRFLIALTGLARFAPAEELSSVTPYRMFKVDFVPFAHDLESGSGEEEVDRDQLLGTLKRYLAHRKLRAEWEPIAKAANEFLVNWLSLASPFSSEEKQALLEAPTLKARAEMLVALAEMELASGDSEPGSRIQ